MTTVRLKKDQQPETAIKADATEATRLYMRGVAAARGGQRRVAAGLLTRSVKLDPRNEKAWLWLSGVLDDPHQIAFCLNSVLKLNPQNERAQKGLAWLESRHMLRGEAQPAPLLDVNVDEPVEQRAVRESGESWWVNWRQWRRDSQRTRVLLLSIPVVLLVVSLLLYQTFSLAVANSVQPPPPPPTATPAPPPGAVMLSLPPLPTPVPTPVPVLSNELGQVSVSKTIQYLDAVAPVRQNLQRAVNDFRETTGTPGGALEHIAAVQDFMTSVEAGYDAIQAITPPPDLQAAHQDYLLGLEVELMAISDLMEFYGSYEVELANRAALRFQQANGHFAQARMQFDMRLEQIRSESVISVHTAR